WWPAALLLLCSRRSPTHPPPLFSLFLLSPLFSLLCFIWRVGLGIPVKHGRGVDVLVPLSEWSRGGFDLVSDLSFGCRIFLVSLVSLLGLLGWVSELAWLKAPWGPSDGGAAVLLPLVGLVSSGVLFGPVNFLSGASRSCLRFQAGLVFDGFSVAGACAARMVAGWRLLSLFLRCRFGGSVAALGAPSPNKARYSPGRCPWLQV
ncbi:unnamed protein product, partial [Brassica oleracea]